MIFSVFQKIWVFGYSRSTLLVLLSASVERFSVSRMQDFCSLHCLEFAVNTAQSPFSFCKLTHVRFYLVQQNFKILETNHHVAKYLKSLSNAKHCTARDQTHHYQLYSAVIHQSSYLLVATDRGRTGQGQKSGKRHRLGLQQNNCFIVVVLIL